MNHNIKKKLKQVSTLLLILAVLTIPFLNNIKPVLATGQTKALWCTYSDITASNLNKMVAGDIYILFLVTGNWDTDLAIHYDYSDASFNSLISTIKAKSANFQVYAYVYCGYSTLPDFSSSYNRGVMAAAAVDCMNRINFDGFHDDIEGYDPFNPTVMNNLVAFWNTMSVAVRASGHKSSCTLGRYGYQISSCGSINVDYIAAQIYDDQPIAETPFKLAMDSFLDVSLSPMLIGCEVRTTAGVGSKLEYQLNWVTEQFNSGGPYAKFEGVSIYVGWEMNNYDYNDWTAYIAWTSPISIPTPPPPNTPTLLTPTAGATLTNHLVSFTWTASIGATDYQIQILGPSNYDQIVYTNSFTANISNGPYSWRVRAHNGSGYSVYSALRYFTMAVPTPSPPPTPPPTPTPSPAPSTGLFGGPIFKAENFRFLFFNGSAWRFQNSFNHSIVFTVESGKINSSQTELTLYSVSGRFKFLNPYAANLSFQCTQPDVAVTLNNLPWVNGTRTLRVGWNEIRYGFREEWFIDLPLLIGIFGLILMFIGPILGIMYMRKRDYHLGLVFLLIVTLIGFSLLLSWLLHGS